MSNFNNYEKKIHTAKEHRIPRAYKEVEKVLLAVKACKGNIKTVMHNSRLRGYTLNKVYSLAVNVLKHRNLLEKIIEKTALLEKVQIRKEIAGILIYEMIFGKGLPPGESKPVLAIKELQDEIQGMYEVLKDECAGLADLYSLPKYVRVNSLKTTTFNVLKDLENWEYLQVSYDDNITFDEYLELVKSLNTGSFLIDYHFKDVIVFSSKENLSSWPLYQKGHVFIQDKSSYIPVHVLDPKPDSTVIDACAAPGMKTIHIAALMQNNGKIFAFERDKERFETLQNITKSADIKICKSRCEDFYLVNTDDPKYSSVECILVDPSCSGTGMVNRMDEVTDTEDSKNKMRFQKLAGFQILLLKHALSFPSVKRVVYSTCSITEEENEFVVHEVLNCFRHSFKLGHVMPHWPVRGLEGYEYGPLCLRASPQKSLTNGFFVAVFERLEFEEQQEMYDNSLNKRSFKERKSKKRKCESDFKSNGCTDTQDSGYLATQTDVIESESKSMVKEKSKKKKRKSDYKDGPSSDNENVAQLSDVKHNVECDEIPDSGAYIGGNDTENFKSDFPKSKKKHKKGGGNRSQLSDGKQGVECDGITYLGACTDGKDTENLKSNSQKSKKKHKKNDDENRTQLSDAKQDVEVDEITYLGASIDGNDTESLKSDFQKSKKKHKKGDENRTQLSDGKEGVECDDITYLGACIDGNDTENLKSNSQKLKKKHKKNDDENRTQLSDVKQDSEYDEMTYLSARIEGEDVENVKSNLQKSKKKHKKKNKDKESFEVIET